jgi:DNA-binding transcriptional ArsR family regulator
MEAQEATEALFALAQEHRLRVFRLLMRAGPDGMAAGEIARSLGIPPSTLSAHLALLHRARLIRARRQARHVNYSADIPGTRRLIAFLAEDCCRGHPELCGLPKARAGAS